MSYICVTYSSYRWHDLIAPVIYLDNCPFLYVVPLYVVALDNLVDLIDVCIDHPAAANRTLLVSDCEDLSTSALLQRLAGALGRRARLLSIPERWIARAARLFGQEHVYQRLVGDLQVDASETCELLGWAPPVRVDEALAQTARHYLGQVRS